MTRLVVPKSAINGRLASKSLKNLPPDDYRDRLIKYIPAESVALYVAVDKMVNSHYRRKLSGQPWLLNAVISTIAFVLWAYTLSGSVFLVHQWYSVFAAGLLAPIFTFVAGFFEPKPE